MVPRESYGVTRQQLSVKSNMDNPIPIKHTNVIPTNIDHVPSNAKDSCSGAMMYIFEDNEAVRTHRVALDGCLTGLIWTQKIQIRYIDTKHQFADMLTKGNFTRDEWNDLLHLFNISHFSSTCCTKNFSLISCITMARRIQNQKEEGRVVSKSRPAAMNLSSFIATSLPPHRVRLQTKSPATLVASGKPDSRMSIEPSSFDAASTSQVRPKDAYLGGWKSSGKTRRIKKKKNSEDSDNPAAGTWYYKEALVAQKQ